MAYGFHWFGSYSLGAFCHATRHSPVDPSGGASRPPTWAVCRGFGSALRAAAAYHLSPAPSGARPRRPGAAARLSPSAYRPTRLRRGRPASPSPAPTTSRLGCRADSLGPGPAFSRYPLAFRSQPAPLVAPGRAQPCSCRSPPRAGSAGPSHVCACRLASRCGRPDAPGHRATGELAALRR